MESSIIIVIPYFGQWPFWMPLFLASCKANPSIKWLLISDCGKPENLPENVTYRYQSFVDYKLHVSSRLEIDFSKANHYKLCDVKPMLGFIHEEDINGFDFWAFGDLDLVYGDLRAVYSEEILQKYLLISNHATRISGHLCLLKNTREMRNAFRLALSWKQELENDKHCATDEKSFSRLFVKHKNFPQWLRKAANSLYPLVRNSLFVERFTTPGGVVAWRDGTTNYPEKWYWHKGRLWNNLDEKQNFFYPYFHFLSWKGNWTTSQIMQDFDSSKICIIEADGISFLNGG